MLKNLKLSPSFDGWFAAIPARMYLNRELNGTDRDVYGVIMVCLRSRGGSIEVGQEEMGEFLGLSSRQVRRCVAKLVKAKEITAKRQNGASSIYTVSIPERAQKPADEPEATKPAQGKRKRELIPCPRCRNRVGGLLKVGWCRQCNAQLKMERVANRVYDERTKKAQPSTIDKVPSAA